MKTDTTSRDFTSRNFFEGKYQDNSDPWLFATSEYELNRYTAIVEALKHRRYRRAFEPGCSIGVLTAQLAALCDQVEAVDISPTAVQTALERCGGLDNVAIQCGSLPDCLPQGSFDLVVLSEIGYYFTTGMLLGVTSHIVRGMLSSGVLLAVHWLGHSEDHVLSGDTVHTLLSSFPELEHEHSERTSGFRLDRWRKI